ncbi:FKBP-type peptidyl-prolyl cis-trans isomerase [Streptomyces sp. NPDC051940]|uniref:FKBP-type peptidyl-prolyl cis-trans isomerase n=1 Tax=Streptomyces sp. NPDC051940 TaxID=3155675 RepID=UPI00342E107C
MNLAKKTRFVAAIAVPALLLTAACGSDDSSDSDQGDKGTNSAAAVSTVSGTFGQKPTIKVPSGAKAPAEIAVKTLVEGKGDAVAKGDYVRLDFAGVAMKDSRDLGSTWATAQGGATHQQVVAQTGEQNPMLPPKVLDAVVGKTPGSRVLVEGSAGDLVGDSLNPQSGIKESDGLVWAIDVVGSTKADDKAEAKGTMAAPKLGLKVDVPSQQAANITIPKDGDAPTKLEQQVLIKGAGAKVEAGQGLIVQYTGVSWEDGKQFDSSWKNGGATAFQIGTGSVVKGWDQGLVGKKVGDRVLLVIPPKLAYGDSEGSELAKKTLVFVVDIVGTV